MMINVINPAEIRLSGVSRTDDVRASSTDVNFFNSALTPSSFPNMAVSHFNPQTPFADAAGKLTSVTERMTKSLRALSGTNKFDEARKYPSQLSDALLLTHMLTKSVGKTAQCIDKISNLQ